VTTAILQVEVMRQPSKTDAAAKSLSFGSVMVVRQLDPVSRSPPQLPPFSVVGVARPPCSHEIIINKDHHHIRTSCITKDWQAIAASG